MSLAKARARIRHAHCSVGRISKKFSPRAKKGKVLVQGPKRGTRLRTGARVSLVVGQGPRRA
jgi:beta-lactam-binding protein with PASTA domain